MKVSVLAVTSKLALNVAPAGDKLNSGVDWTVACGGNPISGSVTNGACGTFAPAHTSDGVVTVYTAPSVVPINNIITITAALTGNPSQSSALTLTILNAPIAVALTGVSNGVAGPVQSSVNVNQSLTLTDTVNNDPLDAGVIFTATCGSPACGSFQPVQVTGNVGGTVYTAPSLVPQGGSVTIKATSLTDTTKSATATIVVVTPVPPPGIGLSVVPSSLYVETIGLARHGSFTALVANDTANAGVDWTVSCSAANCGSITAHTASGAAAAFTSPSSVPAGGTVTVTAASTSNPSISASATANIVTQAPIQVTDSMLPPATLATGANATLTATVSADPNNLGVDWTAICGGSTGCGTFSLSPAHTASGGTITYTAPSQIPANGGVVAIEAISSAASASTPADPAVAIVTIIAQPPSVTLTLSPPATLETATQSPVSATVTNDVAPGGVIWSVQCSNTVPGGCGYVSPAKTANGVAAVYTASPIASAGVTITATSAADPAVNAVSNPITINPNTTPSVAFVPFLPAQIQPGATVNLTAAVANDASNTGVDWQVCASGCGFFTIKPAIAANPAAGILPQAAVTATSVSGWSNDLPIVYTAPVQIPVSGSVTVTALAHVDNTKANSGVITITNAVTGPALNGAVKAGTLPVVGANISLFAAGTSGYASGSAQIASSVSNKNGTFTVAAGYTCPSAGSQMFLVATGGSVGMNAANTDIGLMTALGSCINLGSTPVVLNEVTTVASAYTTAPFASNDALNGNSSALYLGASSTNAVGLANAFATVNNLVDITTGQARYTTPAGNAAVPYVQINTLANALNACTASAGGVEGDGSPCGTLLTATDVLPASTQIPNVTAPADTLQAAFNIAQFPLFNNGYNLGAASILSLAGSSASFQPILTAFPDTSFQQDWSLSLNYTGGGGLSSASTVGSFALDSGGNLWITDTTAGSVVEWNAVGAAISPSTGFSQDPASSTSLGGSPIAINANGSVWISGTNKLVELNNLGTPVSGSPFKGAAGVSTDMAIDQSSNLWIASGGALSEFSSLGVPIALNAGLANEGLTGITSVGIDSANNVWAGFAELTNPGGNLIFNNETTQDAPDPGLTSDNAGDMWGSNVNEVCEGTPYAGPLLSSGFTCIMNNTDNFNAATAQAFDGARTLWVATQGGTTTSGGIPLLPSLFPIGYVQGSQINYESLYSPTLANSPLRVAVDGSGNVWVLLANQTVTEYVGVAVPVVTPVALGLAENKLAAKP